MKFLVCIKQVVDTSKMEVDPETGRLKRNNANSIMNPVDLNALEAALSLRDRIGGTVTVITMGPPQAEAVLRDAVAMGADDIYLVTDRAFGGADTLATSYTLAAAISKIGMPDLIFCGIESIDSNTAQIGPEIAATLGIADVSGASFISFEKEGACWIGVPGIYHPNEEKVAYSFGFDQFMKPDEGEVELTEEQMDETENFGYWCRRVSSIIGE